MYFVTFMKRVMHIKRDIYEAVQKMSSDGYRVVAYGAAAKGMTLMNYFDLSLIEYVVDDAPLKQYKYTPGTNKLILPPSILQSERGKLCIVVFAWNFKDEILKNIRKHASREVKDLIALLPFPQLSVLPVWNMS